MGRTTFSRTAAKAPAVGGNDVPLGNFFNVDIDGALLPAVQYIDAFGLEAGAATVVRGIAPSSQTASISPKSGHITLVMPGSLDACSKFASWLQAGDMRSVTIVFLSNAATEVARFKLSSCFPVVVTMPVFDSASTTGPSLSVQLNWETIEIR